MEIVILVVVVEMIAVVCGSVVVGIKSDNRGLVLWSPVRIL